MAVRGNWATLLLILPSLRASSLPPWWPLGSGLSLIGEQPFFFLWLRTATVATSVESVAVATLSGCEDVRVLFIFFFNHQK